MQSCGSNSVNESKTFCPLQAPYDYFDQIDKSDFHFTDLDYRLNDAKGKSETEKVDIVTKEFAEAQNSCIKKLETQFPIGSVKIPFEQLGGKDSVIITSAYISGFSFPWTTATSICYYFTVEYEIRNKEAMYISISLKYLDLEGDIIYMNNLQATSIGKSRFIVKAQPYFKYFTKLLINQ